MLYIQQIKKNTLLDTDYLLYLLLCLRRYVVETTMVFVFQYSGVFFISPNIDSPPFNAPLGLAFALSYIRGWRCVLGVLFGLFCSHLMAGFELQYSIYIAVSYLFIAYLMAKVCHLILKSDLLPFAQSKSVLLFLLIPLISCLLIPALDALLLVVGANGIFRYISGLNGVLLFGGYLLTMAYIPYVSSVISDAKSLLYQGIVHLTLFASLILNYKRPEFAYIVVMYLFFLGITLKKANIAVFSTSIAMFATIIQAYYFVNFKLQDNYYISSALTVFLILTLFLIGYKSRKQLESMLS